MGGGEPPVGEGRARPGEEGAGQASGGAPGPDGGSTPAGGSAPEGTPVPAGSPPLPEPLGDGTRVIHAGLPDARQHEPLLPGPQFASLYHLTGDPTGHPLEYGRYGNPTWAQLESALGELEGGQVFAFASGMAAVAAVLMTQVSAGDVLLLPSDGYPSVRDVARGIDGVEVRTAPTSQWRATRSTRPATRT